MTNEWRGRRVLFSFMFHGVSGVFQMGYIQLNLRSCFFSYLAWSIALTIYIEPTHEVFSSS